MANQKVCFLVGSMSISGGTYVIVQHAAYLHDLGYNVTLAVQEVFNANTYAWHDCAYRLRIVPIEAAKNDIYDLVIATWWKTALELANFNARHYAYFVQSLESRFYHQSERPLRTLVDATYGFPVSYVTEATWIQDYLETTYGHNVALVRNGIRKDIYLPSGPTIMPRNYNLMPRVLVEGPLGVSFKNTALGIQLALEAGAKEVWLLTGTRLKWIPGVSRIFSCVPMTKTPYIYRSCDILVKLSSVEGMFGPPLEMFHCGGTAIVFDVTGFDEYINDGENAYVVKMGDMDGVVSGLRRLLYERTELLRLQRGALQTADLWPSWVRSSEAFHKWVKSIVSKPAVTIQGTSQLCDKAFATYIQDEQARLRADRKLFISWYARIVPLIPKLLLDLLRQLSAVSEVVYGARRVR